MGAGPRRGHLPLCRHAPTVSRLLVFPVVLLLVSRGAMGEKPPAEYRVKAAFVRHFVDFASWPDRPQPSGADQLTIGVADGADVVGAFKEVLHGEKAGGRHVAIKAIASIDDLSSCDILFVSKTAAPRGKEYLSQVATLPVLTVGETDPFLGQGGIIRFFLEGDKVRFEISPQNATKAGLRLSSRLLAVARVAGHGAPKK